MTDVRVDVGAVPDDALDLLVVELARWCAELEFSKALKEVGADEGRDLRPV